MKKLSKSDMTGQSIDQVDDGCKRRAVIDEALYWALRINLQRMYGHRPK